MNLKKITLTLASALLLGGAVSAQEAAPLPPPPAGEPFVKLIPRYETGFAAVLLHEYQSGASGTRFNFLTQGGQDTLYPYQRFTLDAVIGGQNIVTFLYQPLTLKSSTVVDRNGSNGGNPLVVDGVSFAAGTPLDINYGFDFWRASWMYDFAPEPQTILAAGLSLQVRNASIVFGSADGNQRSIQQNIGPVPILKARAASWLTREFNLDFEVDGFYASSAFFNGSGKPFKGWIWDASLTAKTRFIPGSTAFVAVRTIGGGAEGNNAYSYVSSTTSTPGGFTWNNLATAAVTFGFTLE